MKINVSHVFFSDMYLVKSMNFRNEHLELYIYTLPETNIAPEHGLLEDYFPFGKAYFWRLC